MTARLLFRRVHLIVSLAVGLWLAAAALAGSLLVFGDALDQTLHPQLFAVARPGVRAPLDRVVAAAESASDGRAVRVRLAGSNTPVHEVWIDCDDCRRAWIDPSTAAVNGVRSAHGTTRTFLHELHRRILLRGIGDVGALVGGVALCILTVTGLLLGWRGGLRLRRTNIYELHRVSGLLFAPVLLVAGGTGVYFIQAGLRAARPPLAAVPASLEPALHRASAEFPDAQPTWVSWTASEIVVRLHQSAEAHPNGRTFVRVDRRSGAVTGRVDALRAPASTRLVDNLYPLHIGAIGGTPHRIVLIVAGLSPAFFLVTGLVLYTRRAFRRRAPNRTNVRAVLVRETTR